MIDTRHARLGLLAASLCLAGGSVSAQMLNEPAGQAAEPAASSIDPSARATLDAAAKAISGTPGFGAQFRMLGEGSDLIKSTMPSMSGRFTFGTVDGERVIHMLGEAKDTAEGDSYAFDFARSASKLAWTDDSKKTVFVRRAKPEPRTMPGAARMILVTDMLDEEPFKASLDRSETVVSEGTKNVAGVACDVVLMTFAKKTTVVSHTGERWFIAQSDGLPRRFEQITDAGMIKFSLIMEFSGVQPGVQAPAMLDVRRPEGYTIDDQTVVTTDAEAKPTPVRPARAAPGNITKEAPSTTVETRPTPAVRAAPAFAFTDDGGAAIDNNTQMGRVSVLYYWGTWCVPCRAVSPEISKIAERFGEQNVDVFGVAVRERDPEAARSYIADKNYKHRLVLGADQSATAFRVRVYPTVIVIDPQGNIAYTGSPGRDRSATELASEVAAAVQAALGEG